MKEGYKNLHFYKLGREIALMVYKIKFPVDERYALQSQARRCSTSLTLNLVEGYDRESPKEIKRFFEISRGSARELMEVLEYCLDLKYISLDEYALLTGKLNHFIGLLINYSKTIK